jgi:hypothetical protein
MELIPVVRAHAILLRWSDVFRSKASRCVKILLLWVSSSWSSRMIGKKEALKEWKREERVAVVGVRVTGLSGLVCVSAQAVAWVNILCYRILRSHSFFLLLGRKEEVTRVTIARRDFDADWAGDGLDRKSITGKKLYCHWALYRRRARSSSLKVIGSQGRTKELVGGFWASRAASNSVKHERAKDLDSSKKGIDCLWNKAIFSNRFKWLGSSPRRQSPDSTSK